MIVVDELHVVDGHGVEVWVIPSDDVSQEPDALVTFPLTSPAGDYVRRRCLGGMASQLQLDSEVVGIVHDGEDGYTIRTADGTFVEIDERSAPNAVRLIHEIGELAGQLAFQGLNKLPEPRPGGQTPISGVRPNRLTVQKHARPCDVGGAGWRIEEDGPIYLPGQINQVPDKRRPVAPGYTAPNRLRSPSHALQH